MTMHLVGPYLSTTGKSKSKKKFRSAAEAQRARQLEQDWNSLKSKWGVAEKTKKSTVSSELPTIAKSIKRDAGPRPASLNTWNVGAVSSKATQQYTGDKILGIGTLHKSNAVPIFSNQEAEDIAKMRR
jgi:hypothetical protein